MPNYGLLTEMANGIREGMLAYQTASQIKRQNQLQNLQQGLVENPQTGQLEYTPEAKQKVANQARLQQLQIQKLEKEIAEPNLEKEYKKAQIDWLKSRAGEAGAREGYLESKSKGLIPMTGEKPLKFTEVANLRKEFNALPEVKQYQEVQTAYEKVKSAAQQPSAAGDMSMIYGYMKMLDPGSTVREGEFANAQNAAGIPDQIRNAYNKVQTGQRLNPTQRADFLKQAEGIFGAQQQTYSKAKSRYEDLANLYKVSPEMLFGKQKGLVQEPTQAPMMQKPVQMTPEDQEAADWLKANPNDPSAAKVRAKLGAKYGL